ncbi:MAG TPA: FAD-dependent oxidoreductase [Anaerolineae bacterium]|nr:FAD-dependent oxidoreductase [Anaerolineae bacterium]
MSKERLVVIGGDAAGMSAASQARRRRPDLEIVAFERSPHTSYSACSIPYYVGGLIDEADRLVARTPRAFRERYDIDVRTLHEAVEVDLDRRRVRVHKVGESRMWWEPFDQLLIATGALPVVPDVPGADAEGIFAVSTLQSGIQIRQAVDERRPQRAVIVGGGYVGLEMAEALRRRGAEVALVDMMPQVMNTLDADMAARVADALREEGVDLYLEEPLLGFDTAEGRVRGVVTEQRTLPADVAILGMGVRPNAGLAAEAGLDLGERGSIVVNERMQTAGEGVWAAGDCAQSFHLVSRRPTYVALGTVANKQGRVAGTNIGGGYATFPGVVGTAITKFYDLEIARTGLQQREVSELGRPCETATIESHTRLPFMPGAGKIAVKLLVERGSGRLLGGQIVGAQGSAKRIDVIAVALHAGMTAEELIDLDLGYAPPYSPVWDPVAIAARQVSKRV